MSFKAQDLMSNLFKLILYLLKNIFLSLLVSKRKEFDKIPGIFVQLSISECNPTNQQV